MRVVAKDLLEQLAHDRAELLLLEPRDQRLLDHRGDIGLLDVAERVGEDARALGDEAFAVAVGDEPLPYAAADSGGLDAFAYDVLAQEVVGDELLQALARATPCGWG